MMMDSIRQISMQGIAGSFHDAVRSRLFPGAEALCRDRFSEVFEDVRAHRAPIGIMAIENSIAGSLVFNYDLLSSYDLRIVGEAYLRIRHNLMALPGHNIQDLKEIWSHPMAIYQSQVFLNRISVPVVEKADTAASARAIAEGQLQGVAAIAAKEAATKYGLQILAESIETDPNNYTRFLMLSSSGEPMPHSDEVPLKCSLYVRLSDKAGDLYHFLGPIHQAGVNMTKIESRPRVGSPWHYDFYIDLDASGNQATIYQLLQRLEKQADFMRVLGIYPAFGYI